MFDIFGSVKGFIKLDSVCIDTNIFKLHYKATVVILVAFSLLVTSKQYIGDPIDCIVDEIPSNVMDTYCWIYSTYTVPDRLVGKIGYDILMPGVATHIDGEDEVKYHKYYQWVCFALFFQAMLFYIPRYIWKNMEKGRMKMLVLDLDSPVIPQDCKNDRKHLLVQFLYRNMGLQDGYAYKFFVCELINFVNVVTQIFFMDWFLDGEFSTYGWDVLKFTNMEPEEREDPMAKVFPKVTKCTFHKYGPSGSVQKFDGLCVLPLNIVNEKIYVFLWFWFVALSIITGLALIYRLLTLLVRKFRFCVLKQNARMADVHELSRMVARLRIGDWFILNQLGKNIDPVIFKEVVHDFDEKCLELKM